MLSVQDGSILAGDDWVACTVTLGTAVAGPPVEGTAVACEVEVETLFDSGVSVADEPHATTRRRMTERSPLVHPSSLVQTLAQRHLGLRFAYMYLTISK